MVIVVLIALFATWIAPKLPFHTEVEIASRYPIHPSTYPQIETYLQNLADKLAAAEGLPPDMKIQVHYRVEPVINAYATLGGHIVIYRGLIEKLPNENALAMVLAHEIAHVKHRHPAASLGRGVAIALVVSTLTQLGGNLIAENLLSNAGLLTALSFSRGQEQQADSTALAALVKIYGHVGGAKNLFATIQREQRGTHGEPPKFLSTHPLTEDRIAAIDVLAKQNGWSTSGNPQQLQIKIYK